MRRRNYIVYARTTGGAYITERATPTRGSNFRWVKSREAAARLSQQAAVQVARYYGGVAVKV